MSSTTPPLAEVLLPARFKTGDDVDPYKDERTGLSREVGCQAIWSLSSCKPDVSIWLHQAVKGFRDKDGNPLKNAHLLGVFFRICKLLNYGVKPVFVFDGGVPVLKRQTLHSRKSKKLEAQDSSEITRKKLLSNLIRSQIQTETKQAIPPSVLIKAGIAELASSAKRLKSPKKRKSAKTKAEENSESSDENDLENLRAKLESSENINSALFAGINQNVDSETSSDEDDYRGGRNYAEHFSSITSADFDSLPLEVQHEILFEMQESKKNNSWAKIHEMPKDLQNFSSFQMDRLVKRRFLQKKIRSVQQEMGSRHIHVQNLDEIINFENEFGSETNVETQIVGSKEKGAVLIKLKAGSSNHSQDRNPGTSSNAKTECIEKAEPEVITIDDFVEEWSSSSDDESSKNVNLSSSTTEKSNNLLINEAPEEEDKELELAIELSLQEYQFSKQSNTSPGERSKSEKVLEERKSDIRSPRKVLQQSFEYDEPDLLYAEPEAPRTNKSLSVKEISTEVTRIPSSPAKNKSQTVSINSVIPTNSSVSSACGRFLDKVRFFEVSETTGQYEKPSTKLVQNDESASSSTDDDDFEEVSLEQPSKPENSPAIAIPKSQNVISIKIDEEMKFEKENDIFACIFEENEDIPSVRNELHEEKDLTTEVEPSNKDNENFQQGKEESEINLGEGSDSEPPDSFETNPVRGQKMLSMDFLQAQEKNYDEQEQLHNVMGAQDRLATTITDQMYKETQELLGLFGVPYVISPTEAESQCAFLDSACLTDGTITDDNDIFLFGGRRVYKNFFAQGEKPVEFFQYSEIVQKLSLEREKLVLLAILSGSDYTTGIEGVGPITALEIISEFPPDGLSYFESLIKFRNWWMSAQGEVEEETNKIRAKLKKIHLRAGFPNKAIFDAYMEPTIDTSTENFRWGTLNLESLIFYTKNKFGWDQKKCEATLRPVLKSMETEQKARQLTLDNFIHLHPLEPTKRKIKSKRLANAMKKLKKSVGRLADEVDLSSSDSSDTESGTSQAAAAGSSSMKRKATTSNVSNAKKLKKEKLLETQVVKKVRIPKTTQVIPQKVQEDMQKKNNKLKAIEILKSKKNP